MCCAVQDAFFLIENQGCLNGINTGIQTQDFLLLKTTTCTWLKSLLLGYILPPRQTIYISYPAWAKRESSFSK